MFSCLHLYFVILNQLVLVFVGSCTCIILKESLPCFDYLNAAVLN